MIGAGTSLSNCNPNITIRWHLYIEAVPVLREIIGQNPNNFSYMNICIQTNLFIDNLYHNKYSRIKISDPVWFEDVDRASAAEYVKKKAEFEGISMIIGLRILTYWVCYILSINTLWPSDAIWRHRSGSTLAQVMACYLMAWSHYLNQYWLIISKLKV